MEKQVNMKFNILVIFAIIIFCFAISPITLQNDTYYTIKIGEHILEDGIDMQDPFSWHENMEYTYPHWAYDVFIYLVYNIGGMWGIYLSTVILASVLGISIYFVHSKLTKNNLISFLITLGMMFVLRNYIAARAQLITFICFILGIYFIEQFIKTKKKRYSIFLIINSLVIANVHVAVWPFFFILFLPYMGEYLFTLLIDLDILLEIKLFFKKTKQKSFDKKGLKEEKEKITKDIQILETKIVESEIKREKRREDPYKIKIKKDTSVSFLIMIIIICIFMGFLTPIGDTPFTYLYKTMQGNSTNNINEHLPLTLVESKEAICVLVLFLGVLLFTDTKIRLRDLFMTFGLILLTFYSRRQLSLLVLIGGLMMNRLLTSFFNKYDKDTPQKVMKMMTTFIGKTITILVIILLSILILKPKANDTFVNENSYPVQASEYILNNIDIENMRLYNEYNYGSYLLYKGIPVFIDSRADLYTQEFNEGKDIFEDFMNISNMGIYYEGEFERYEITHVIMYKNAKLNLLISKDENYNLLYSDNSFVIYERLSSSI